MTNVRQLERFEEPSLVFGCGQTLEEPRDGLSLFGPLDQGKPYGVRAGVIGTIDGIERFRRWVVSIQSPVIGKSDRPQWDRAHPVFPGFEAVFDIPWSPDPVRVLQVPAPEIQTAVYLGDQHQRVFRTVDAYAERIIRAKREDEEAVDIWFVVVPEDVYRYCRPRAVVPSQQAIRQPEVSGDYLKRFKANTPSLFEEDNVAAVPYRLEVNFHHQLKARLLDQHIPTQIVRETTIAHRDFLTAWGAPTRSLDGLEPDIAWHLAAATFYKVGGRPWKLGGIREGVCYIGLVFKQDQTNTDERIACCAAQMFLDSGDGLVFKGDVGPWYSPTTNEFHINRQSAMELVSKALRSYIERNGKPPRELFLHGRVRFNDVEWAGFADAVPSEVNLVGVRIRKETAFKLFRLGEQPVLRGVAYVRDHHTAYLWTKGYTPRLGTYAGREVPNPLLIDVCRGRAPMETVLRDILALTKVNYNACRFADGVPVTLKFADQIGEILTAGVTPKDPPLQFWYYI